MILINGQWQGGGNKDTFQAAQILKDHLSRSNPVVTAPVCTNEDLIEKERIIGLDELTQQIQAALQILQKEKPTHLMTVGGGCDADTASLAYMNALYQGDLTVIWMDAHGDINSPNESASHLYYGMPIRALLGECPPISDLLPLPLQPEQLILFGCRDLDQTEKNYISENQITLIPVLEDPGELEKQLTDLIQTKKNRHLYIHLDLDVLDPHEFPHTPLPAPGTGFSAEAILSALHSLKQHNDLVGTGVFEFKYTGSIPAFLKNALDILCV
jgi:arginase